MKLATIQSYVCPEVEEFMKQLKELSLVAYASEAAKEMGFSNNEEMVKAVQRSIRICENSGVPTEGNFKPVYKCSADGIEFDWKLSSLAYNLVCINGESINPKVAHKQIELLKYNPLHNNLNP